MNIVSSRYYFSRTKKQVGVVLRDRSGYHTDCLTQSANRLVELVASPLLDVPLVRCRVAGGGVCCQLKSMILYRERRKSGSISVYTTTSVSRREHRGHVVSSVGVWRRRPRRVLRIPLRRKLHFVLTDYAVSAILR